MRKLYRLQLYLFIFLRLHCRTLLSYLTLSKPGHPHHKETYFLICSFNQEGRYPTTFGKNKFLNHFNIQFPYGGDGGNRTHVQRALL